MYDAVQLLAKALHEMDRSQEVSIKSMDCNGVDTWHQGASLINYMKMVNSIGFKSASCVCIKTLICNMQIEIDGLTGPIKFDTDGVRSNFHLNIVGMLIQCTFSFELDVTLCLH